MYYFLYKHNLSTKPSRFTYYAFTDLHPDKNSGRNGEGFISKLKVVLSNKLVSTEKTKLLYIYFYLHYLLYKIIMGLTAICV